MTNSLLSISLVSLYSSSGRYTVIVLSSTLLGWLPFIITTLSKFRQVRKIEKMEKRSVLPTGLAIVSAATRVISWHSDQRVSSAKTTGRCVQLPLKKDEMLFFQNTLWPWKNRNWPADSLQLDFFSRRETHKRLEACVYHAYKKT